MHYGSSIAPVPPPAPASPTVGWPPEVDLILSALEIGQHAADNRRALTRRRHRVAARFRLFTDPPGSLLRALYTRDACPRSVGFITAEVLPLGYGGILELPMPGKRIIRVQCTVQRCRLAAPGWYEGALHFIREQPDFA
jgi:hypothetical protein